MIYCARVVVKFLGRYEMMGNLLNVIIFFLLKVKIGKII